MTHISVFDLELELQRLKNPQDTAILQDWLYYVCLFSMSDYVGSGSKAKRAAQYREKQDEHLESRHEQLMKKSREMDYDI